MQRERAKTLKEMAESSLFFFRAPATYDAKAVRKNVTGEILVALKALAPVLAVTITLLGPRRISIAPSPILPRPTAHPFLKDCAAALRLADNRWDRIAAHRRHARHSGQARVPFPARRRPQFLAPRAFIFLTKSRVSGNVPRLHGAIAQLGRALAWAWQEVGGSIPPGSTRFFCVFAVDWISGLPRPHRLGGLGHHPFTVRTGVRIPVGDAISCGKLVRRAS